MNALISTAVSGIVLMLAGLFTENRKGIRYLAIAGIAVAFLLNLLDFAHYGPAETGLLNHMLSVSRFGILFNAIVLGCTLMYFLLSGRDFGKVGAYTGEYFALIFFI